jgi:phosphate starvation-inducible PhoH-like protein
MQKSELRFVPAKPAPGQEQYQDSLENNIITICTGYAGTGKTFLAVNHALTMMFNAPKRGGIQRIVIVRPYIQSNTGEKLGALPGTVDEKVTPYVLGLRDNLRQMFQNDQDIDNLIRQKFEFTVLSLCRGRSFNNCFVIVEEAQNVPLDGDAMKMLLTRVGKHSKLVIAGDMDQCDINPRNSALIEAVNVLDGVPGIGVVSMEDIETVQRSPIVKDILRRYEEYRKQDHL